MQEADEKVMRQYLLGELAEAEMSRLEERLMTEGELFEMLTVVEDELIDERLDDALSPDERKRFDTYFLSTPARRERLEMPRGIRVYAARHANKRAPAEPPSRDTTDNPAKGTRLENVAHPKVIDFPPTKQETSAARRPMRRYLILAAAAVLLLTLGWGIWRIIQPSDVDKGLAALNHAYRQQRPTEARITGFDYAPRLETRGSDSSAVDAAEHDRAKLMLLTEAQQHPSAKACHALGKSYLAERNFDEAIKWLDKSLSLDTNNARLYSDLGAAYLEKGIAERGGNQAGRSLEDYARSLDHLSRALELNDSLLEALFNRALCHQYLMMLQQAEDDWRKYLDKDSASPWADDARENLRKIEEQRQRISANRDRYQEFVRAVQNNDDEELWRIISQGKDVFAGKMVYEQVADAYLDSKAKKVVTLAGSNLELLSHVGALELLKADDASIANLVAFYRTLPSEQVSRLAQAQELMQAGREFYNQSKYDDGIRVCSIAQQTFARLGDDWESALAQYWVGYCNLLRLHTEKSQLLFESLAKVCEARRYRWLLVRVLSALSAIQYDLNEYSKAISYITRSADLAERIADTTGLLNASSHLIEYYRYLGNAHECLAHIEKSLPLLLSSPGAIKTWRHYSIIASSLTSFGFNRAAADYQEESLGLALATQDISLTCVSYAHLGVIYGRLKKYSEAFENVRVAYETAKQHSDDSIGLDMMAYASLQRGNLYRQTGDFSKALSSYDECIDLYTRLNFTSVLYQAHKGRLVCYIEQADDSLAEDEIKTTMNLAEQYRSKIAEDENRNSFFDSEQSIYDLAIDFEYTRRGDPQRAFDYSEASRARSLLGMMNRVRQGKANRRGPNYLSASHPLTLTDLQQRLPNQVQILQYAVSQSRLIIWLITNSRFASVDKPIEIESFNQKVRDYTQAVSRPTAEQGTQTQEIARDLYSDLIGQVEPWLDPNKQLFIVPDKILNYIPFCALISPAGRYLVEDHYLARSPSSTLIVVCSEIAAGRNPVESEQLLSVGNPRFDRSVYPQLLDLPSARQEAIRVAAFYKRPYVLVEEDARKHAIESEMKKSDVIHLALHSLVDEWAPRQSRLILAGGRSQASGSTEATFQASELYQLSLPRTRLVILSACQTGIDRCYQGEGMTSIARPFMAAGVPLVVASLWAVDSRPTANLMSELHRYRKKEALPTIEALTQAQRAMLKGTDARLQDPYYWAPFFLTGGYAKF
ncbi:MAG: CHAT domain-containing tetratricopeptide repeat protein [Blastocatellia bacterium]